MGTFKSLYLTKQLRKPTKPKRLLPWNFEALKLYTDLLRIK